MSLLEDVIYINQKYYNKYKLTYIILIEIYFLIISVFAIGGISKLEIIRDLNTNSIGIIFNLLIGFILILIPLYIILVTISFLLYITIAFPLLRYYRNKHKKIKKK